MAGIWRFDPVHRLPGKNRRNPRRGRALAFFVLSAFKVAVGAVVASVAMRCGGSRIFLRTRSLRALAAELLDPRSDCREIVGSARSGHVSPRGGSGVCRKPREGRYCQRKITADCTFLSPYPKQNEPGGRTSARLARLISFPGTDMSEEVRGPALEPSFTTKEEHKGTGRGLNMICGVA